MKQIFEKTDECVGCYLRFSGIFCFSPEIHISNWTVSEHWSWKIILPLWTLQTSSYLRDSDLVGTNGKSKWPLVRIQKTLWQHLLTRCCIALSPSSPSLLKLAFSAALRPVFLSKEVVMHLIEPPFSESDQCEFICFLSSFPCVSSKTFPLQLQNCTRILWFSVFLNNKEIFYLSSITKLKTEEQKQICWF